jgi:lysophospholipase L1-like esterase
VVFRKGGPNYLLSLVKARFIKNHTTDLSKNRSNTPYPAIRLYPHRKTVFESLPHDESEIIFLGDSFIDFAEWSELFNDSKIKNRGIAGDRTDGVLLRLNDILSSSPAKIFIMIGYNDLSIGRSIPDILQNFKKIIENIRTSSPQTKIYIHSLLPVKNDDYRGKVENRDIINLNHQLAKLCERHNVVFIDLFSSFCGDDNQLLKEFSSNDGLHLSGKAYLKWRSMIEKFVYS